MAGRGGREGRSVMIAGAASVGAVARMFQDAFGLAPFQTVVENEPFEALLRAIDAGSWVSIWPIEPDGHFTHMADMELDGPIEVAKFSDMARKYGVQVAYACDEQAQCDDRYYIASPGGVEVRTLLFEGAGTSYRCNLA